MATPKLQTTKAQRASEIPLTSILPALPDGRNVIVSKRGIYVADVTRCSCGDFRMQKSDAPKEPCKHMLRLAM